MAGIADFAFDLPAGRIAQSPTRPRDAARLLCVRANPPDRPREAQDFAYAGERPTTDQAALEDCIVRNLPALLCPGDVLVMNDTRVIPAQLTAMRGGARLGITLDQPRSDGTWRALARNARRLRDGDTLTFGGDLAAMVMSRDPDGSVTLRFNKSDSELVTTLSRFGALALPPYIRRPFGPEPGDATDYQTAFATHDGAVAAPTSGLHFTPELLAALYARGVQGVTVTLHVGAGTFLPVRSDDIDRHQIHSERGQISVSAARAINHARAMGRRIVAVGTTSLRLLESAVRGDGTIAPFDGETSLFIRPGYRFRAVDLLMTNFHLPHSTLFMLVCAFAGTDTMRAAYDHAIAGGYRFYSYGDSSLLWRHDG
jgi:S-adenosylmethionine:tRNA ribosyltransferase-isomerase